MAVCVTLNSDGTLSPTNQTVDQCTGYVMLSGSEYGVYQVVQDALGAPTPDQAAGWFFGAWGAVMVMYMAGKFVGAILSMFNHK